MQLDLMIVIGQLGLMLVIMELDLMPIGKLSLRMIGKLS